MKIQKFKNDCIKALDALKGKLDPKVLKDVITYINGFLFGRNNAMNPDKEIDVSNSADWESVIKSYTNIYDCIGLDNNNRHFYKDLSQDDRLAIVKVIKESVTSNLMKSSQLLVDPVTLEDLKKKLFLECITKVNLNRDQSIALNKFITDPKYLFKYAPSILKDVKQKDTFKAEKALEKAKNGIKGHESNYYQGLTEDEKNTIISIIEKYLKKYFPANVIDNQTLPNANANSTSSAVSKQNKILEVVTYVGEKALYLNDDRKDRPEQVKKIKDLSEKLNVQLGLNAPKKAVVVKLDTPNFTGVNPEINNIRTSITFRNQDALVSANELQQKGCKKPLVINLANKKMIGGGWEMGANAQEESLFYRSNLFYSLYPLGSKEKYTKPDQLARFEYENHIEHDTALYCKDITALYASDNNNYRELAPNERFMVDVLTIAGYDLGKPRKGYKKDQELGKLSEFNSREKELIEAYNQDVLNQDVLNQNVLKKKPNFTELRKVFTRLTEEKVTLMLQTAITQGNDSLVLGAISCGAFKFNSDSLQDDNWTVDCVTEAYRNAFEKMGADQIKHFKEITFAVTGGPYSVNVKSFQTLANDLQNFLQTGKLLRDNIATSNHKQSQIMSMTMPTKKPETIADLKKKIKDEISEVFKDQRHPGLKGYHRGVKRFINDFLFKQHEKNKNISYTQPATINYNPILAISEFERNMDINQLNLYQDFSGAAGKANRDKVMEIIINNFKECFSPEIYNYSYEEDKLTDFGRDTLKKMFPEKSFSARDKGKGRVDENPPVPVIPKETGTTPWVDATLSGDTINILRNNAKQKVSKYGRKARTQQVYNLINLVYPETKDADIEAPKKAVTFNELELKSFVPDPASASRKTQNTIINVENEDCLLVAKKFQDEGCKRPLVMNLANKKSIGGGWANGAEAQEEDLFRRSNLFQSLYAAESPHPRIAPDSVGCRYSKKFEHKQAKYSKDVRVLFAPEDENGNFRPLDPTERFNVDVLTIHGYNLGKEFGTVKDLQNLDTNDEEENQLYDAYREDIISQDNGFTELAKKFTELTKNKIILSLKIAMAQGNDSLVLGAISCGAFRFEAGDQENQLPKNRDLWTSRCVAKAYEEAFRLIGPEKINKHFKRITFAVKTKEEITPEAYNNLTAKQKSHYDRSRGIHEVFFKELSKELKEVMQNHSSNESTPSSSKPVELKPKPAIDHTPTVTPSSSSKSVKPKPAKDHTLTVTPSSSSKSVEPKPMLTQFNQPARGLNDLANSTKSLSDFIEAYNLNDKKGAIEILKKSIKEVEPSLKDLNPDIIEKLNKIVYSIINDKKDRVYMDQLISIMPNIFKQLFDDAISEIKKQRRP